MTELRRPQQLEWELAWQDCQACPELAASRNTIVFGEGNPESRLVFIGDGPGGHEDYYGRPFVGKAGSLLRSLLTRAVGLSDDEFFFDNVILCRATLRSGEELKNRTPSAAEIRNCHERLMSTLYFLDPILIVALGNTALQALTGNPAAITKVRGMMFHTTISGMVAEVVYPVLATYHPNYLNQRQIESKVTGGCWDQMIEDLRLAAHIFDDLRERYFGIPYPDRAARIERRLEHSDD